MTRRRPASGPFAPKPRQGIIRFCVLLALVLIASALVLSPESLAQGARHPFAVGANEGAAGAGNVVGRLILAQESGFYRLLTGAVRAVKESAAGAFALIGLSFAYGVVHAAGPGHGKAVIASYMLADEKTFARGVIISAAAALLQGTVAVTIVAAAALLFHATSKQTSAAANLVEIASYAGITILGTLLVYHKGKALLALLVPARRKSRFAALDPAFAPPIAPPGARPSSGRRFVAESGEPEHEHSATCGHALALGAPAREASWKTALLTVLAAGLRPCSGAILVLVFALSQGVLAAGILSVGAMALGTALTTSTLAALAVFGKKIATRLAAGPSRRALLVGRSIEALAALVVLGLGLVLLATALAGRI